MKPAWPVKPTLSIPTLLMGVLRVTPIYYQALIFSFAEMLPVKVFIKVGGTKNFALAC